MPPAPAPAPDRAEALAGCLPDLTRAARRLAPRAGEAEDLVQEAVARVLARLRAGDEVRDLRPYLLATLRNLARRPRPGMAPLDDEAGPAVAPEAEGRLAAEEVLRAVAGLPPEQAVLLRGIAFEGASLAQLARRHGLPVGTVTSRVVRGRARLARRLGLPPDAPVTALLRP